MSQINKFFVIVKTEDYDLFYGKYCTGENRNTDYDRKVVFLEKTQEIFAHGKIYGLNNASDVTALSTKLGTLPKRPAIGTEGEAGYEDERDYVSIIEYIQEMATGQASVSSKLSESITVAGGPLADDIADIDWLWGVQKMAIR